MEETKEEEEMIQVIMKKTIIHTRSENYSSTKVILQINMNILLYMPLLFHLLRIHGIVGWLIVGPLIASLVTISL